MEPRTTQTTSRSASRWRCFINIRRATYAVVSVWIGLVLCGPVSDAWALPTADEVLQELQISDSDQQRIREGKIVEWTTSEGSERELALGMALLAKTKAENIVGLFREAAAFKTSSAIKAHGRIEGAGTLADFAHLKLEPNGKKEAQRYLDAEPGGELNLDAKEIADFRALKAAGQAGAAPVKEVEALVRQTLLSRYQAYRTKGLPGIAPYQRGDKRQLHPGDELSLATKQMKLLAKYVPSVYNSLLNYPVVATTGHQDLEEQFYWLNIDLFGRPTYVLSHRMLFRIGEAHIIFDRHFYASHDYNSLQQAAVALPTKDGMLVTYLSRVSTDQVAGLGSKAKHPVSRALMAPYIKDLLVALRAKAEKR
ncbi:MAG: hypothetical protein ACREUJ_03795 [Burkholderiales bacterium]